MTDYSEFRAYLHNCTDAQVRGVAEKEYRAGRDAYVELALYEAVARGIDYHDWLPPKESAS